MYKHAEGLGFVKDYKITKRGLKFLDKIKEITPTANKYAKADFLNTQWN